MDFEENNGIDEQDDEAVEIYSKRAIFWFSVFFSPLAGGILLWLNLRATGNKKAGSIILVFSLLYLAAAEIIEDVVLERLKLSIYAINCISFLLTFAGAAILAEYFFKKYFPDDDYYPKSVNQAIAVAIGITIPVTFFLLYYSQQNMQPGNILHK